MGEQLSQKEAKKKLAKTPLLKSVCKKQGKTIFQEITLPEGKTTRKRKKKSVLAYEDVFSTDEEAQVEPPKPAQPDMNSSSLVNSETCGSAQPLTPKNGENTEAAETPVENEEGKKDSLPQTPKRKTRRASILETVPGNQSSQRKLS